MLSDKTITLLQQHARRETLQDLRSDDDLPLLPDDTYARVDGAYSGGWDHAETWLARQILAELNIPWLKKE